MDYLSVNIYLLLLIFSMLHVFEEFVFPGGFAGEFKKMTATINLKITDSWLMVTNILFLGAVTSTLFINRESYGLSVISIVFINGILHIGKSIQVRRYFPGLITALLFYLPVGVYAFSSYNLSFRQKMICFVIGVFLHLLPFVLLITVFGKIERKDGRVS